MVYYKIRLCYNMLKGGVNVKKEYIEIAGYIPEEELDELLSSSSGGTSTADWTGVIVDALDASWSSGFCPTSSCTKCCIK